MLSRVPIPCPECHQVVRVRPEYIGLRVQCNRCGRQFAIPRTLTVACPGCGVHETFRTQDVGRVIRCNRCDAVHEVTTGVGQELAAAERDAASSSGLRPGPFEPLAIDGPHPAGIGLDLDEPVGVPPGRDQRAWTGPVADAGMNGAAPTASAGAAVVESRRDDGVVRAELDEARSQLDRLRQELDALRFGAAEAERLAAEHGALKEEADERTRRHEELRLELERARSEAERIAVEAAGLRDRAASAESLEHELRAAREQAARSHELERIAAEAAELRDRAASAERLEDELRAAREQVARRDELERLAAEAAALRDRAASAEHLERDLQAAHDQVARLRAECDEARAAAATATREVADLIDHSATLQDGFYRALAEIETSPDETLITPREAVRLRSRLAELEGQVVEAMTAQRAVEDDLGRALKARENELESAREELRTLNTQLSEMAAHEAEEARLRARLAAGGGDDEIAAEVAAHLKAVPQLRHPAPGAAGRGAPARRPAEASSSAIEPAARPKVVANRPGGFERRPHLPASGVVAAEGVDLALERLDLRELLPQLTDLRDSRPGPAAAEPPAPAVESGGATRAVADREPPRPPGPAAPPPVDLDAMKAEALRLRAEVLDLISAGRKQEAEIRSRRMVNLTGTIFGELSQDHSTWMTVVGQLQAEQGRWADARAQFDAKNAAFRDRFGDRDPRFLSCVADSGEALLVCGDRDGAMMLFEEAEALSRQALHPAHPFAVAVRKKLDQLRGQGQNVWTVGAST